MKEFGWTLGLLRQPSCWPTFPTCLVLMGLGLVPRMGPGFGPGLGGKQINDVIRLVQGLKSPMTSLSAGCMITF
jgi:hypothetical protein